MDRRASHESVTNGGRPTRIAVIGNYSGRNSGDAALLEGLLSEVTTAFPNSKLEFRIPTINPRFIRQTYKHFPVRPVGLLPWNLSLKILGVPIIRTTLSADLILVTDAILFDRKLYNPLFNYLHTLSWVLPAAAARGVPVVLFAVSLGSITTNAGEACLRRILEASAKIIVRDLPSAALARELRREECDPIMAADCALLSRSAPAHTLDALCTSHQLFASGRPVLGFNVSAYLDVYVRGRSASIGRARFQTVVASVLDRAVRELGVDVLMIQTQAMDIQMAEGVLNQVQQRDRVRIVSNRTFDHAELTGLLGRVQALIGMRTHSLILAASMGTPVGGIIVYPKTTDFLSTIGCGDERIEFSTFSEASLWDFVQSIWLRRSELRDRVAGRIEGERSKARAAARELRPWLE
jgi:polysaccharide pyruvyl transferase WcaK-like protein